MEQKIVNRIPLWWAVAITVALATPLAFHLGAFNIPVWLSFIVWAEYLALGMKPSALKLIFPNFAIGAICVGLWLSTTVALTPMMGTEWAFIVTNFIWVTLLVYMMTKVSWVLAGSLPLFNGLSMALAIYFTGTSFPIATGAYGVIWASILTCVVAGYIGAFLGWFNIAILFPHKVSK